MFNLSRLRAAHAVIAVSLASAACALPHVGVRPDAATPDGTVSMDADADADAGPPPPACEAGVVCGDACTVTANDPNNCGACGFRCTFAHATAACTAGRCTIGTCEVGWDDCNADASDGCEAPLNTAENCMGCGVRCDPLRNTTASCATGRCVQSCTANSANCDADESNGCEPLSTTTDCMRCGNACTGATPVCNQAMGCVSGCGALSNCSMSCVDTTSNPLHCGACGRVCADPMNGTPTCSASTCGFVCDVGFDNCDGNAANGCEANVRTNASHCGGCGAACPARANASPVCNAAVCSFRCNMGFGDCDSNPSNGCETTLATTVANCGTCGRSCMAPANATATCAAGACGFTCNPGFADCNGNASDGCEVDTRTSPTNCGMCGRACSAANATSACTAGVCGIGTCNMGFADCNSNATDGCEVDTRTTVTHCGMCGRACNAANATNTCVAGACGIGMCNMGFADCNSNATDGCEINTRTNASNCGMCGRTCSAANATSTCTAGACTIGMCNVGFADCNTSATDGCEVDTRTTVTHCGMCGRACNAANATNTCVAGACGIGMCNMGFADCDGRPGTGCESELASDDANCGACGVACVANATCTSSACVCGAGFTNCGGGGGNPTDCCDNATEMCSGMGTCVPRGDGGTD